MHTAVEVAKVRNMIKCADVKEMSQDKFYPDASMGSKYFCEINKSKFVQQSSHKYKYRF
jgi:hypothetical protein